MPSYSVLARMIVKHSGELSNFRTFSGLQAQSLIYMQAELQVKEAKMKAFMSLGEMRPFDQCSVNVSEQEKSMDAALFEEGFAELHMMLETYSDLQSASPVVSCI